VTRDRITEIFDIERTLETRREEPAERCDKGSEGGENDRVELERCPGDRSEFTTSDRLDSGDDRTRETEALPFEYVIGSALNVGEGVRREILNWADHEVVTHEESSPGYGEDHGNEESSNETFDSLLRTQLDELVSTEEHTADVSSDIVHNDQRSGEPEPDHTLKDIVDDEMTADYDE